MKCAHANNFTVNNQHSASKIKTVFWLTTVVMLLEITAGMWSGSMALLADGWHMGTHSAAFLIAIFAYSYANKHVNDRRFSFGTGKVNDLGGFASAIALTLVALMMVIESIQRLMSPQLIHFNEAILVAFIGLVVNIASVFLLHGQHTHHSHDHHSHDHHDHEHQPTEHQDTHHHDHNMKAAYFHVLADTLTSLLAIVALFTGKYFGWIWMDPVMGIVGAIVIGKWSYGLIKQTSGVLLDRNDNTQVIDKIANKFSKEENLVVNDLHVWNIAQNHQAAIISVEINERKDVQFYHNIIQHYVPQLAHLTVEQTEVLAPSELMPVVD